MKKTEKTIIALCLACTLGLASGCSTLTSFFSDPEENEVVLASQELLLPDTRLTLAGQSPDSLANYRLGRGYAAAGRYELAKEHYLLALASANSRDLRQSLSEELEAVDLMIRSLR